MAGGNGLVLHWTPGQNSIHDSDVIARGQDVGNVTAEYVTEGARRPAVYDVTFAFAFAAFRPEGVLHTE